MSSIGSTGPGTISYHKDLNGWIPAARIIEVPPGKSVTASLERLALPTPGTTSHMMVKVPVRGAVDDFYTVEVRRRVGYEGTRIPGDAVVIHHVRRGVSGRGSPAWVVDSDNNGNPNDAGSMWTPGETFVDGPNGIRISVLAESPTAASVLVTQTGTREQFSVTTLAGMANVTGATDGTGSAARFNRPWGLRSRRTAWCTSPTISTT